MIRAVCFDWGDTLMHDFRQLSGPMVDWPRVEAVPGAEQALSELQPRYQLLVATNADDSGEELVLAALARVGLRGFISAVVSSCEAGFGKPDPRFYNAVLGRAACAAREAVMVGDGYENDVRGAVAAGLRAVWYNPTAASCPAATPVHAAEVRRLEDLPGVIAALDG